MELTPRQLDALDQQLRDDFIYLLYCAIRRPLADVDTMTAADHDRVQRDAGFLYLNDVEFHARVSSMVHAAIQRVRQI